MGTSGRAPPLAPQLTLADVARDGVRRKFFLDAFPDEKEALELGFAFLERVRLYKQLIGRRDALQTIAEEIVGIFLRDPPEHLCVFQRTEPIRALVQRVCRAVERQQSTPDLFSGIEAHVADHLERHKFVAFLRTPQYQQLCDALRKRRELPLGEILVDPQRTRFLSQFIEQASADGVGNLLFWIDVQTVFLPLIQTTTVSVALFEEIQSTVRRLYNQYLTESSTTNATVISDSLRKETLKRILQMQGEPFSPSRYATLFRPSQEKIWHWMQTAIYPKFQASMFYVALLVEAENLESDRRLRKLSEHVQATRLGPESHASTTNTSKLSAIVLPANSCAASLLLDSRFVRVMATPRDEVDCAEFDKVVTVPPEKRLEILDAKLTTVTSVSEDGRYQVKKELHVVQDASIKSLTHTAAEFVDSMGFIWNWRHVATAVSAASPSHRAPPPAPKPAFRNFWIPVLTDNGADVVQGYALTTWVAREMSRSQSLHRSYEDSSDVQVFLPRFAVVLASHPCEHEPMLSALRALTNVQTSDDNTEIVMTALSKLTKATDDEKAAPRRLTTVFSAFYLKPHLSPSEYPVETLFNELSHQTVIAVLGCLLIGKPLVVVSPRPQALVLVVNTLLTLLQPFTWHHLVLPLCPVRTARALADRAFFAPPTTSSRIDSIHNQQPFIIGVEANLVHLKSRDQSNEPRHRIRNSIYSVQRVSLQFQPPQSIQSHREDGTADAYPVEILHTHAVILDIDADDVYFPERVEFPEFPQALVRVLELNIQDAKLCGQLANQDSLHFSSTQGGPSFHTEVLEDVSTGSCPSVSDSLRLAGLSFMESLFGDVVLYFCSYRKPFASSVAGAQSNTATATADTMETLLIFDSDMFLDAKIEVGCREFFRQVFQTELFRQYLLRQHARFCEDSGRDDE